MSKTNLKPCPACGGVAKYFFGARANKGVYCSGCGTQGPSHDPEGERWNAMPRREDYTRVVKAARGVVADTDFMSLQELFLAVEELQV